MKTRVFLENLHTEEPRLLSQDPDFTDAKLPTKHLHWIFNEHLKLRFKKTNSLSPDMFFWHSLTSVNRNSILPIACTKNLGVFLDALHFSIAHIHSFSKFCCTSKIQPKPDHFTSSL